MKWNTKEKEMLVSAFLCIKTRTEMQRFLRDILTLSEINELSKRLQTACMLNDSIPYTTIEKRTSFSSTTIARVAKWLKNGTGGYKIVLAKIHHQNKTHVGNGLF
jgi:TrpR-related protein YerC/YecD